MNYLKKLLIFLIVSLFYLESSVAQLNKVTVSIQGSHQNLVSLINDLEKGYQLSFYYKIEWIDSITVPSKFNNESLDVVLRELLPKYNLFYTAYNQQDIYITKEKINLDLINENWENEAIPEVEKDENNGFFDNENNNSLSGLLEKIVIGEKNNNSKNIATLSGVIKDAETGEPLLGASVYVEELKTGTAADANGNYMLSLRKGDYTIIYRSVGKEAVLKKLSLLSDGRLNIGMAKNMIALDEVVVKEDKYNNTKGMQIGFEQITMKEIRELPPVAGERDILKASLLLPGVQTIGESAAGYNIRGGGVDQNLFLINNVPVYNTSHMFGFFSTFNPDVIRNFNLYKSNIPVEYGGRISSVFDIQTKNGNNQKFSLKGGISPITAKISAEGPIIKDKSSYILGLRSTYSNWILKRIENPDIRNSNVYFHDFVAGVNNTLNENNNLSVFAYYSLDNYSLPTGNSYNYANTGTSLNWQHFFGKNLYSNLSLIYSNYRLDVKNEQLLSNAYIFKHSLTHYELNHKFSYSPNPNHEIKFGYSAIYYAIKPGNYSPIASESNFSSLNLEQETAVESAIYLGDKFDINSKLGVEGGIRFSFFNYLGPKTIYNYMEHERPSSSSVVDTSYYDNFNTVKTYLGLDIRLSVRYLINPDNSIKFGFNRITQYLFLLTNTVAISPTDRWKLSDKYTPPIVGDQYNIGYYRNFSNTNLEASVEIYYKNADNLKEFKNGAELDKNEFIERDLISGIGRSYGFEFMLKKAYGRINGWVNYTYSRSELKFAGNSIEEIINHGNFFPSNTDKPHNINLTTNMKANRRLSFSANFTYSTGRPTTYPVSKSFLGTLPVINYSDRNSARIPDYWRVDIAFNLEGNLIRKKLAHAFWTFSVYNITGRKNAYSIYFTNENGQILGHKISIFAKPIFTLTFNFKLGNYSSN